MFLQGKEVDLKNGRRTEKENNKKTVKKERDEEGLRRGTFSLTSRKENA